MAENRSALTPSHMACPSVPTPRKTGYWKIGYFSDTRGRGASSRDHFAVGFPHGDTIAVRRPHHDAFDDGLTAHERLFAAFQNWQQLRVRGQANKFLQRRKHNSPDLYSIPVNGKTGAGIC